MSGWAQRQAEELEEERGDFRRAMKALQHAEASNAALAGALRELLRKTRIMANWYACNDACRVEVERAEAALRETGVSS